MSDWTDQLQPASFRGIPFAVETIEGEHGRNLAIHVYPFRDESWAEDLGRKGRNFTIAGFLISDSLIYGGGSAIDQEQQMIAAAETQGPGVLVHPTQGEMTVSVLGFVSRGRADLGEVIEIQFRLYEAGLKQYPSGASSTTDATDDSADDLDSAAGDDFSDAATDDVANGSEVIDQAAATTQSFTGLVASLGQDATSLLNMTSRLPGNNGRYSNGANAGGFEASPPNLLPASTTIDDLVDQAAADRATISSACLSLQSSAQDLGL